MWPFKKKPEEWVLLDHRYGPWKREVSKRNSKIIVESQSYISIWYNRATNEYKVNGSGPSRPSIIGVMPSKYRDMTGTNQLVNYILNEVKVNICDVLRYSDY